MVTATWRGDDDGMQDNTSPEPEGGSRGKRGSASNIPLAISGVLLLMTGFLASMPGGFWQMFGLSAAFALWALMEAETRPRRMMALVLATVGTTSAVMDYLAYLAGR